MEWVIPVIASAASILAAVVAGGYASRSKNAEIQASRIQDLERRLATSKTAVYEPMIELLRTIMDEALTGNQPSARDQARRLDTMTKFGTWVQIYGSDGAVQAFHRFMQASYATSPALVLMRFYGEFVLEARRDLGDPETKLDLIDILGIRMKDLYPNWVEPMSEPLDALYRRAGWSAPWGTRYG